MGTTAFETNSSPSLAACAAQLSPTGTKLNAVEPNTVRCPRPARTGCGAPATASRRVLGLADLDLILVALVIFLVVLAVVLSRSENLLRSGVSCRTGCRQNRGGDFHSETQLL
jgi:hypothetical protein